MDFCEQYIIGDNGMLVDMTFLPRIKEGEIRLLMLYNTPVNVVHKKPAEDADAFSATLLVGQNIAMISQKIGKLWWICF